MLEARDLRTPLILQRGPINQLLLELKRDWCIDPWFGVYTKHAKNAYNDCGNKVNYAYLVFGKNCFSPQDAFAQSTASSKTNPLLTTSILGPRVRYKEQGVSIGVNLQRWFQSNWRAGFRSVLPIRKIRVKRLKSCGNGSSNLGGQTFADVAIEKTEVVGGVPVNSFAYRLDFLSQLPYACTCLGLNYPIVNYRDPDFPFDLPVTISNQDISQENGTPVSALKSINGSPPAPPFAIPQSEAQSLPIIGSSGQLGANRGRFDTSVNYLPLSTNTTSQSMLFIVPSVANGNVVAPARIIKEQVDELLACIAPTAETIFADCGLCFDSQCIRGAGDLGTELFIGGYICPHFYSEAFFGLTWPTGKKVDNPHFIFRQPLGNNGHHEIRLGLQALWEPTFGIETLEAPCAFAPYSSCNWLLFKGDFTVSFVLPRTERVAAPFVDATVKNIGPAIPARIHWKAFTLHLDALISPPSRSYGIDLGYELYHKSPDHVQLICSSIADCLGNMNALSPQTLEIATQMTSHKIRTEFFADFCLGNIPGDFFVGGSWVVSGRNTPIDSDFDIGLTFYF